MSSTISLETGKRMIRETAESYAQLSPAQQNTFRHVWDGAEKEIRESRADILATIPYKILNSFDFYVLAGLQDGSWRLFYATVPLEMDNHGGDVSLQVKVRDEHRHIARTAEKELNLDEILKKYN